MLSYKAQYDVVMFTSLSAFAYNVYKINDKNIETL